MGQEGAGNPDPGSGGKADFHDLLMNHEMRGQIESLQKHLIDLRTQQLLEIEEIKMNCEIDLMEEKRSLKRQKHLLEQKFAPSTPGQSPGELLDQNQRLQENKQEL